MAGRYVVGIDLGTTNCALAYADLDCGEAAAITALAIPQLVAPGVVEAREVLPSFLYLPVGHELTHGALTLPWDPSASDAIGIFAREQGGRIPGRLVSSAKSWLCHTGADRRGPILPWHADEDVERLSPVAASARYLAYLRRVWDHQHPDHPLVDQEVLLAVPASFDTVARELTIEAALAAGLSAPRLIEEPQAAFYAWIEAAGTAWREQVAVGDRILVCDVGGGTTDFSLIAVSERDGNLELERVAVGRHLLVGGDNMDLALARALEAEEQAAGRTFDDWQIQALWHACRGAKERLLSGANSSETITLPGRGSRLIGGARQLVLTRDRLDQVLVEGFFPHCDAEVTPRARVMGLAELGLPYEADPAITHHLAAFKRAHGAVPIAGVLFNGGVFSANPLRERMLDVLAGWQVGMTPRELAGARLELAVACGAAAYGLARHGRGIRIRGGTARSYYLGVESAMPAVPGLAAPLKALCVAPHGMEEGSELKLPGRSFGLLVGAPARFRVFCSAARSHDTIGDLLDARDPALDEIDPVELTLPADDCEQLSVPVSLESCLTELGLLELWAVEVGGPRRWKLEYEVRQREAVRR